MLSKEEIETCKQEARNYFEDIKDRDNAGWLRGLMWYIEQLESDNYEQNNIINSYIEREQKLIEKLEEKEKLNDKYLQKLVYALSPTTHALGDSYNNAFKSIIANNIELETCKIKRELKDCWEGRF